MLVERLVSQICSQFGFLYPGSCSQVPQPTCFCNFQVMCAIFKKVILIQLVLVVQICLYLFSCYSDVPKEDEDVFG